MELAYTLPLYTGLLVLVGLISWRAATVATEPAPAARRRAAAVREPHFRAMVLLHIGSWSGWGRGLGHPACALQGSPGHAGPDVGRERLALVGDRHSGSALERGHHGLYCGTDQRVPQYDGCIQWPIRWIRHPNYVAVFLELLALPLVHAAWLTARLGQLSSLGAAPIACAPRSPCCAATRATRR